MSKQTERSQARKTTAKNGSSVSFRFINVELGKDEKNHLAALLESGQLSYMVLFDLVHTGYKISIREDAKNNSFLCSCSDTRDDSPNFQRTVTGRGSSAENAIISVGYKVVYLLGDDWDANTSGADSDFG